MLLATGMGVKEALLYNVLSSVLCFAGMAAGILMVLGSTEEGDSVLSPWVFAATAGIFLYLALVDMIPELSNSKRGPKNPWVRVALQVAGMVTGFGVMFMIAYHEETLHAFLKT
jgi:zinc transporter 10